MVLPKNTADPRSNHCNAKPLVVYGPVCISSVTAVKHSRVNSKNTLT